LFQLCRIERLSRSWRLVITLLRIGLTGIRRRRLRARLLRGAPAVSDEEAAAEVEDDWAPLDPLVNTHVLGSDPIEAADFGLKNIDRVMPLLVPGTTQPGGGYARTAELYEALIMQRHRELLAVAKLVGGVEETRYQAGRGPVPP